MVLTPIIFTLFQVSLLDNVAFFGNKKFIICYAFLSQFHFSENRVRSAHRKTFAFATASVVVVVGREFFLCSVVVFL